MNLRILWFAAWVTTLQVQAQHPEYARKVIGDLCSEDMAGRGYVKQGAEKAAQYIAAEYKKAGLMSWNGTYFQELGFPVIAYPYEVEIKLDDTDLIPGEEFIVSSGCPSLNGVFDVLYMDSASIDNTTRFNEFMRSRFSGSVIALDVPTSQTLVHKDRLEQIRNNTMKARALIYYNQLKLTWGASLEYDPFPRMYVVKGAYKYQPKKATIKIVPEVRDYAGKNVAGYIKGTTYPDSFIVVSAHYDHLGMMGTWAIFPGGNDNASGVAMMLDLMNEFKEHPPKYSVCFIAFCGEEAGLLGSYYYTEHPLFPLQQISMMLNLDLMATGDKGMTIVNATLFPETFQHMQEINLNGNYLSQVAPRGKAQNSDHYYFSEKGVKAFFLYLMGEYHAYHDIQDTAEAVTLSRYSEAFQLIRDFVSQYPY